MSGKNKYKDTLNLPQTDFPMRGNLAKREPEILEKWEGMYQTLREQRADAPKFTLHDGPPYANGHIHYGHIMNKVLKDLVVKTKTMMGFDVPFTPGWDTHGLPIELAVDRELGKKKRELSVAKFRELCAEYAHKFVDIQKSEFKRLGVFADWDKPYLTLQHNYEAAIIRAIAAFARGGYLYRKKKPVYWSPGARTALAESEIEYKDHTSPSIFVRFPLASRANNAALNPALTDKDLSLVIWTTTPWTIPANLAVVIKPDFEYVALKSPKNPNEYLMVAKGLAASVASSIGLEESEVEGALPLAKVGIEKLEGERYHHPFIKPTEDNQFRLWFADYVTLEQGTGLVHTAPGHGADDFITGRKHGLEPYAPVDERGCYTADVPLWEGEYVFKANPKIVEYLDSSGHLLNKPGESIHHSYPHCWRTKGPVIFRATPQWFLKIDHNGYRERALAEIKATKWVPEWSENRISAMIGNRPDWCLSRQRTWGVPIPVTYCPCGESHADAEVMDHIAKLFSKEGANAWYTKTPAEILPVNFECSNCGADASKQSLGQDIVDVWFESGCSWHALAGEPFNLPEVDLYLEGSDQHRGWFHSSLLVALGVQGKAPYKEVITHGFVLDQNGNPYSKSAIEKARREGKKVKYVAPADLIANRGAEILRMWIGSTDFRNDTPYTEELLSRLTDWYRKFRNTSRFMLGVLDGFDPKETKLQDAQLSALDRRALEKLGAVVANVRKQYENYEFHQAHRSLVDYVSIDLSAFYLDAVKDALYANGKNDAERKSIQAVIYQILRSLTLLSAPVMAFTCEDIWSHLPKVPGDPESVHLAQFPVGKLETESNSELWDVIVIYRELALKELEAFRKTKQKTLDAHVRLLASKSHFERLSGAKELLEKLLVVSEVEVVEAEEPAAQVSLHSGERCGRCWKRVDSMSTDTPDVCNRCASALAELNQ